MREKSDINKILEGRCRGQGASYVGFKKVNESHSTGTATQIYDPIANRIVDTLSVGETTFFWLMRFDDNVEEIREQIYLVPDIIAKVAIQLGIRVPQHVLTTDFLVKFRNGSLKAFSIKPTREIFDKKHYHNISSWERLVRRQILEKRYWEMLGVQWELVFSDELNVKKANNISSIMKCYNSKNVTSPDHMYRYLLAHKYVVTEMDSYIPFAQIANKYKEDIQKIYWQVIGYENE